MNPVRLLVLGALLVSGCAAPPVHRSPFERGIESKHELRREPHQAAVCIARNIDEKRKALNARIVQGREPVLIEVQVSALGKLVALAQLLVSGDASIGVIFTTPELAQPREELVTTMIEGC